MTGTEPSFQQLQRERQKDAFVGRVSELNRFEENLSLAPRDPRRKFVIGIHGQGGMGKSTFLRRCQDISRAAGAASAWSDEADTDLLEVMDRLASDLEEFGEFDEFRTALSKYRSERLKLEGLADAPADLARAIGGAVGRIGTKLARRLPVAGAALELVDEDEVGAELGELATFIVQHTKNRSDAELLLRPVDSLSPLFVEGLGSVASGQIAIFFDTYEDTEHFVEPWVLALLDGTYGRVPQNIVITLAGRYPLNSNAWAQNESLLYLLELHPLSVDESTEYLGKKGVSEPDRVSDIIRLAQGVPIRLVSLVIGDPSDPQPSDTVVDRVLRSVPTELRAAAIEAAIPRFLNRDIARPILGEDSAAFDWLLTMPFVEVASDGWVYHSVIRRELLEHARRDSPDRCLKVHELLADYHDEHRRSFREAGDDRQSIRHAREALYHNLCAAYRKTLPFALRRAIRMWNIDPTSARRWVTTLRDAERDGQLSPSVDGWGVAWIRAIDDFERSLDQPAILLFSKLLASDLLSDRARVEALEARSFLYSEQDRFGSALDDITTGEEVDPADPRLPYLRAGVHLKAREFEEALRDCERSLEMLKPEDSNYLTVRIMYVRIAKEVLDPPDALELIDEILSENERLPGALLIRGQIHRALAKTEQSVQDFQEMMRLAPSRGHKGWKEIGFTYAAADEFSEAETAFKEALAAFPRCGYCWRQLAWMYLQVKEEDEVPGLLAEVCADEEDPRLHAFRGFALLSVRLLPSAREELRRAVEEVPNMPSAHLWLGQVLIDLGESDTAGAHIATALRLRPEWPSALAARGYLRYSVGRYDEAEEDWKQVEKLSPGEMAPIAPSDRGLGLSKLGRFDEAISQFEKALETGRRTEVLYNLAVAETLRSGATAAEGRLHEAKDAVASDDRPFIRLYGEAGLHAVKGEADQALSVLSQAVEADSSLALNWAPTDPAWSSLKDDSRFQEILEKANS